MHSKEFKKMMARKMSHRQHGAFQKYNPTNSKEQAHKVFEARVNKKKIPQVSGSKYAKRYSPYYDMSQEEWEKKFL